MQTAATDGDATERAIAAAETSPPIDRAGAARADVADRMVGSHEVARAHGMPSAAPLSAGDSADPDTLQGALTAELGELERELGEIGMLVGQAREEAERHESRRAKGEERVNALESDPRATPDDLREARRQL